MFLVVGLLLLPFCRGAAKDSYSDYDYDYALDDYNNYDYNEDSYVDFNDYNYNYNDYNEYNDYMQENEELNSYEDEDYDGMYDEDGEWIRIRSVAHSIGHTVTRTARSAWNGVKRTAITVGNKIKSAFVCKTKASQTTAYKKDVALRMLHYSMITYCVQNDKGSVNSGLKSNVFYKTCWNTNQLCKVYNNHLVDLNVYAMSENECMVGYDKDLRGIVIAFSGSESGTDWLRNLDAVMTNGPCSGCKLHKGFVQHLSKVKSRVISKVKALQKKYKNAKVYVSGHSLGGATGQIFAYELLRARLVNSNNLYVYTFGSPRVFNKEMAKDYDRKIKYSFRVVNHKDPVPNLGYHHTKQTIWYKDGGSSKYQVCYNEDRCCVQAGEEAWKHFMPGYILGKTIAQGANFNDHRGYFGLRVGCKSSAVKKVTKAAKV